MEFINHRNIFSKLTKLFMIFGTFLVVIAALIMYYLHGEVNQNELDSKSHMVLQYKQQEYQQYMQNGQNLIMALKDNKNFLNYVLNNENKNNTEELFYTLAQGNNEVLQLRFLDAFGHEKIRINKNTSDSSYYKVPEALLQDKSNRYYFQHVKKLPPSQIYISKLDLNIENEQIEVPYVPTIRVETPIYINETFVGAVIINLEMKNILDNIVNSDIFNVYILTQTNDVLYSNDATKNNWSTVLKLYSHVEDKEILRKEILFSNNTNQLYIALKIKEKSKINFINYSLVMIVLVLMPASLVFAFLLQKKVKFIFDKFEEQNKYAIQQVKLESIGKLLENIAHQWRQPLNVISSLSSSSKMMLQMELLKTHELYQNLDQITSTCIGLSHTIDDFKNFFKMDASISSFRLLDLKDKALEQLEDILNKNDIEFITDKKSVNLKMRGSQQTLEHLLLVIIKNAIDAHLCSKVKKKYIFFSSHMSDKFIVISIKDNALGIDESLLDKIFEPYFTTHNELEGKGMGLYIVHQVITQQLGGHIEVKNVEYKYNQLLCKGAEFQIILPIKK